MIIDAMDLLYTGRFDSFCIVSSDSDFTRLAARIREQGVTVYGFGERKTNHAFVAACDKFVYFDVLNMPSIEPVGSANAQQLPTARMELDTVPEATSRRVVRVESSKRPLDQFAIQALVQAIKNCPHFDGEYANLAEVGNYLVKISPDLNARNYGYDRLREFVEASGIVQLKWINMGDKPPVVLARLTT